MHRLLAHKEGRARHAGCGGRDSSLDSLAPARMTMKPSMELGHDFAAVADVASRDMAAYPGAVERRILSLGPRSQRLRCPIRHYLTMGHPFHVRRGGFFAKFTFGAGCTWIS